MTSSIMGADDPTRSVLCSSGACEFIVEMIEKYAGNENVTANALEAMKVLLRNSDCRQRFSQIGASKLLANLLVDPSEALAPVVCGALANFISGSPENAIQITESGGARSIIPVLKKYSSLHTVVTPACAAILTLSTIPKLLRVIRKSPDAVPILLSVVEVSQLLLIVFKILSISEIIMYIFRI